MFVCVCFIYLVLSSFPSQFNYLFTFIYIFGLRSVDKGKQKAAASDHENKQWSVYDAHTCGNPSEWNREANRKQGMFCFDRCMQFVCLMTWNMLEVRKSEELLSSALHRNVLSLYLNGVWALGQLIFSCLQP